jgi:hypothetical protein
MNKYVLYLIVLGLACLFALSARGQIQSTYLSRGSDMHSIHYFAKAIQPPDLWLSPYLDEEWVDGHIQFADSIVWYGELRLDLFRKQMEMVISSDTFYIARPMTVDLIKVGNSYFVYTPFIDNNEKMQTFGADYFELLSQPAPAKLLLRRKLRIEETGMAQSNMLFGNPPDNKKSFAPISSYYIQKTHDGPALRIKRNRRSLQLVFSDHWNELEDYRRQNKLGFRKVDDIARMVDYYNLIIMNQ